MTESRGALQRPARVRVSLLDVEVTPLSASETAAIVLECARAGEGIVIGNLNLHGAYVFHTNPEFREFCESSDLVLVDGAPIAWAGRIPTTLRVGSTDWIDVLMPIAGGLRILAIGGTPDSSRRAELHMREHFPDADWTGVDGYRGTEMGSELRAKIAQAQVVLVGMGMPLQERWLLQHRDLLEGKVVANVGGCFDYYAGVQHLAPRWMGRFGIEWLYRLARAPRRLANRYLMEPFKLAGVLILRRAESRRAAAES